MTFTTRFAPSPTGPLHLGHAYSALLGFDMAQASQGAFLLRIEDIDRSRSRSHWEDQIYDDLHWLGLGWRRPVMRQSTRQPAYDAALDRLWSMGLLYPCTCSRRDIQQAASAPQEGAPGFGPDGLIYPGTCRRKVATDRARPRNCTLRLDIARAIETAAESPPRAPAARVCARFHETGQGPDGAHGWIDITADDLIHGVGDFVVARKDMATSYHLSVTVDDAAQGVTHVVRGQDLFEATKIHVLLQQLLGLPLPLYHHHRLIRDDAGKRLAKRDDARAIATYRAEGATPQDIRRMVGL